MKARQYQITPPEKAIDHKESVPLTAQIAAAAAVYEPSLTSLFKGCQINGVRLFLDAAVGAVTPATAAATGFVNLYRGANQQISNDGALGVISFNGVANTLGARTNADLLALLPTSVGAGYGLNGLSWVGALSVLVTATATTATVVALGNNLLTTLESTAILAGGTFRLLVDPGTALAEFVTVSAYATGTGVATCSAFVNAHAAGALVVIPGSYTWQGTQAGAMVANTTTGGTLTAIAPSVLTQAQIAIGLLLTVEPGTSNAETFPIGAYNSGTGVYTIAAAYNSGKCLLAHSAGASVAVLNTTNPARELFNGDALTFKWVQSATVGLALPAGRAFVDLAFSGYRN